jgi:hypothetical protein
MEVEGGSLKRLNNKGKERQMEKVIVENGVVIITYIYKIKASNLHQICVTCKGSVSLRAVYFDVLEEFDSIHIFRNAPSLKVADMLIIMSYVNKYETYIVDTIKERKG